MRWIHVALVTASLLTPTLPAIGDAKPPGRMTFRVLENTVASRAVVTMAVENLRVEKRIDWARAEKALAYVRVGETVVTAKVHADSPAEEARLDETLAVASELDPLLGRPPMVELAFGARSYRGVLAAIVTDCDTSRCRTELTVRQTDRATPPQADDRTPRDLGF